MLPKRSILIALLIAGTLEAQPIWETLMQAPLPPDAEPKITVLTLPFAPAPPVPPAIGAGHTHPGPVFAYILQGEIENQVEPDPPQIYKPGGFFYEPPRHVHKFMRNLSSTEPAKAIVFQAGATGPPSPVIKRLFEAPLPSTTNQELSLLRLTLSPGTTAESHPHSGPAVLYVLEGKVETSGMTYAPGDLFSEPPHAAQSAYKNAGSEPAKLLVYQVSEK